jgi:hypothetical protein
MKRLFIISLLLIALTATASAQSPGFIGIKGGLNMFKPYGDDVVDASYNIGFAIGGFYCHSINEILMLQPEIYYSVKGGKGEDEGVENTLKLSYIDIPVLLKFNLPVEDKSWAPNIYAGPYLAFLMAADLEGIDVKDSFKSTDFGLVVGAGLDFKLSEGAQMLSFDVRFSVGFTKIYDMVDEELDAFNNGFQFLVGYGFSL